MELAMRSNRGVRGLTIIEVLVALGIMAFAMLALIPLFTMGVRVNASSNQLSVANSMAREKLEELIEYPSTSPRLAIPSGQTVADSRVGQSTYSTYCANDLPLWYNTDTGAISKSPSQPTPPKGWFPYPCVRTYTVEAFTLASLASASPTNATSTAPDESVLDPQPVPSPTPGATPTPTSPPPTPYYNIKRVTVTVQPNGGPFPGLRKTTQTAWVKFRNVQSN
jgi:type II secretory pathway pseudopilin PulG